MLEKPDKNTKHITYSLIIIIAFWHFKYNFFATLYAYEGFRSFWLSVVTNDIWRRAWSTCYSLKSTGISLPKVRVADPDMDSYATIEKILYSNFEQYILKEKFDFEAFWILMFRPGSRSDLLGNTDPDLDPSKTTVTSFPARPKGTWCTCECSYLNVDFMSSACKQTDK